MRLWQELVTKFSSQFDPALVEVHQQNYADLANMHSTEMTVQKYGANVNGADPRRITGCIKAGIAWHKLVGIGQDRPLTIAGEEEEEEEGKKTTSTTGK